MLCPFCNHSEDRVLESRELDDGKSVRRRRECLKCEGRFTSYERVEERPIMVIKRDGQREQFSRDKILKGVTRACEKRPVPAEAIDKLVDEVIHEVHRADGREVATQKIGELVMNKLQIIDQVSYIRFASVYRQFSDVKDFVKEVKELAAVSR